MKTAEILMMLDDSGIGIDHDGQAPEYCAYWPKEKHDNGSIIVQAKPENLVKELLNSFQAIHLHRTNQVKELQKQFDDFKALVKEMRIAHHVLWCNDPDRFNLDKKVDKILGI